MRSTSLCSTGAARTSAPKATATGCSQGSTENRPGGRGESCTRQVERSSTAARSGRKFRAAAGYRAMVAARLEIAPPRRGGGSDRVGRDMSAPILGRLGFRKWAGASSTSTPPPPDRTSAALVSSSSVLRSPRSELFDKPSRDRHGHSRPCRTPDHRSANGIELKRQVRLLVSQHGCLHGFRDRVKEPHDRLFINRGTLRPGDCGELCDETNGVTAASGSLRHRHSPALPS